MDTSRAAERIVKLTWNNPMWGAGGITNKTAHLHVRRILKEEEEKALAEKTIAIKAARKLRSLCNS